MRIEIGEGIRREVEEAENRRRQEAEDQRNKMRADFEEEMRRAVEETKNKRRKGTYEAVGVAVGVAGVVKLEAVKETVEVIDEKQRNKMRKVFEEKTRKEVKESLGKMEKKYE